MNLKACTEMKMIKPKKKKHTQRDDFTVGIQRCPSRLVFPGRRTHHSGRDRSTKKDKSLQDWWINCWLDEIRVVKKLDEPTE